MSKPLSRLLFIVLIATVAAGSWILYLAVENSKRPPPVAPPPELYGCYEAPHADGFEISGSLVIFENRQLERRSWSIGRDKLGRNITTQPATVYVYETDSRTFRARDARYERVVFHLANDFEQNSLLITQPSEGEQLEFHQVECSDEPKPDPIGFDPSPSSF